MPRLPDGQVHAVSVPWLDLVLVAVFILIGGVFAATELALVSLREGQAKALAQKGRRGQRVAHLVADPNRFLAAVQVGVTLAGFLSAAFGAARLAVPVSDALENAGLAAGAADTTALVLVTLVISYFSLVFSELAPKRLALQRAEGISMAFAPALDRIASLSRPVIWLLSRSTDLVVRMLGGDPHGRRDVITEEELRGMVAAHESLTKDERKLIDDVFAAGERQLREVMLPRTEVAFLDAGMTLQRALREAKRRYDVILVDCPPALGLLTVNALVAADRVIVPVQTEYFALEGLAGLLDTLALIQRELNPRLTIAGMLLTMHDARTKLAQDVEREVRAHFPSLVFDTVIPRNVRLGEAPSFGVPVIHHDPHCAGSEAYFELAKEVAARG